MHKSLTINQSNSGGNHSGPKKQIVDNKVQLDYILAALLLIYNESMANALA